MKASAIQFLEYSGSSIYIESLNYDLDFLKIVIVAASISEWKEISDSHKKY